MEQDMYTNPVSGYTGKPTGMQYRAMTLEEAKALRSGSHIEFLDLHGQVRNAKVNGQPKTWKRSPERVEVPLKYGLYEYARFDESELGRLLMPVSIIADGLSQNAFAYNHAKYGVR